MTVLVVRSANGVAMLVVGSVDDGTAWGGQTVPRTVLRRQARSSESSAERVLVSRDCLRNHAVRGLDIFSEGLSQTLRQRE